MNPKLKKILFFFLRIGLAALMIWFVVSSGKISWNTLFQANPWFLTAAFCCIAGQCILSYCRWFLLLRCVGTQITFYECFSLSMQGTAFSLFIPAGSVGGDLIKAGILAKRAKEGEKFKSVFSILTDRLCGVIALFGGALISCFLFWKEIAAYPAELKTGIYILMVGVSAVLAAAFAVFFHDYLYRVSLFRKCMEFADKYTKGAFTNAAESTVAYRAHWKLLTFCIAGSLLISFPILAGGIYFIAKGTGASPSFWNSWFASNVSQSVAAIPATPGGIGTRDIVCQRILQSSGYPLEAASVTPLLFTVLLLIFSAIGLLFFIFDRKNS